MSVKHRQAGSRGLPFPGELSEVAYTGVLGRLVRTIETHTEADPAAILAQLIAAVGCMMGRRAGWKVEATFHATALWPLVVGDSSNARKGTATGRVEQVVRLVDPMFLSTQQVSGLSSGEGLIAHLSDPPPLTEEEREQGADDPPPKDKRLLVYSPEFAGVLRNMGRQGNTLSIILRELWDHGNAQTLTRHNPLRCTDAHVVLFAHITRDELARELTFTDLANGFANRFLFVAAKHRRDLPFGGNLDERDLADDVQILETSVGNVQLRRPLQILGLSVDASRLWERAYPLLRTDRRGLAGAACTRAEAQVRRIATIHALANNGEATDVEVDQLAAALDLWRYCEQSAYWALGDSLGDPAGDRVISALRAADGGWVPRADLHTATAGHLPADRLDGLLGQLERVGWIQAMTEPTGGRPRQLVRWVRDREKSEQSRESPELGWSRHLLGLLSLYSRSRSLSDGPGFTPGEPPKEVI
jgi:Protein of unknown function (DUF3987)